jgi:hypothetical protein
MAYPSVTFPTFANNAPPHSEVRLLTPPLPSPEYGAAQRGALGDIEPVDCVPEIRGGQSIHRCFWSNKVLIELYVEPGALSAHLDPFVSRHRPLVEKTAVLRLRRRSPTI